MKIIKNTLIVLFSFITISVYSQTTEGRIIIGGNSQLGFNHVWSKWKMDGDSGDNGKTTSLDFSPQVGFFPLNNFAFGMQLPISYSVEKDDAGNKYESTSVAFAPFLKYYFTEKYIKPYLYGSVGWGSHSYHYTSTDYYNDSYDGTASSFLFEAGGGVAIFFNDKVSVDFILGYSHTSIKPNENNDYNYRSISNGLGLKIGIVVLL